MEIPEDGASVRGSRLAAFVAAGKNRTKRSFQSLQFSTFGPKRADMVLDHWPRHGAGRRRCFGRGKEVSDLRDAEPKIPRPPDEGKSGNISGSVSSATGFVACWHCQQPDAFIIANRRRRAARPVGDLSNGQRHRTSPQKIQLALKVT